VAAGASQCGILMGSNDDMPAFRWLEKETGKILVSNHPKSAAEIERRHSTGRGLLHVDGPFILYPADLARPRRGLRRRTGPSALPELARTPRPRGLPPGAAAGTSANTGNAQRPVTESPG